MKILAVADFHGSQYRLNIVLENIKKYSPELVIVCGDITQFGPGEVATNFLNQIPVEAFAIPGNIDTPDVAEAIDKSKAKNIDGKKLEKNEINFIGVGGTHPSQSKISLIEKLVNEESVIISHVPPHGIQDRVFIGMHAGSKELRELVDKHKPRLVICGHIHEDPGYTKTNNTIVVNCSMGKRGEGTLIEINKNINVKMLTNESL
jgi:Icc-related predicted phosphoesterase